MAWDHLSITKPHLVYIILGGFTSLFMLCSSVIKERMYIGEATVATACGLIFGPHVANLIDPKSWGNVDQVTLEFSRLVLVVQCFAVGVELPKFYMERHWRSVVLLLLPVMTFGWLMTSLFIWWMVEPLNWLESLTVAACVTATDPVLASSVVGKGKFAKRVPKHLRDLLSAESGCNDGMAFPFVYLSLYLIHDHLNARDTAYHWIVYTVLYECVFGAIYGFVIGYLARHGIKYAEKRDLIDRESFLVFYFTLALFCAGSGSILGLDDLLVGFAAGVGFSNDGWFSSKTEESHVSNVIDLLLNLAYFVFLGTIIPWDQFNNAEMGLSGWRLVIIAIFVILFRRIPAMLALKPFIPDIKTWREALFAGHFGPIGVGAVFIAILARAELETDHTIPLAELPPPGTDNYVLITLVWPIVTFLVIASILVHGSSIAVFTLGKHINTLSLTMSYTAAPEDGPSWMNRLPRITSQSRSQARTMSDTEVDDLKMPDFPPGTLPPTGLPGHFLRRQREDENRSRAASRASSHRRRKSSGRWEEGKGPGGPVSQSAIFPQRSHQNGQAPMSPTLPTSPSGRWPSDPPGRSSTLAGDRTPPATGTSSTSAGDNTTPEADSEKREGSPDEGKGHGGDRQVQRDIEVYDEGGHIVIEDRDGQVLAVERSAKHDAPADLAPLKEKANRETSKPGWTYDSVKQRLVEWRDEELQKRKTKTSAERKHQPARAYQIGNTIIVEDEDGEVVKTYELPTQKGEASSKKAGQAGPATSNVSSVPESGGGTSSSNQKSGSKQAFGWAGFGRAGAADRKSSAAVPNDDVKDDHQIRFTIGSEGKRMNKDDFLREVQKLDARTRREVVDRSDAPQAVKRAAKQQDPPPSTGPSTQPASKTEDSRSREHSPSEATQPQQAPSPVDRGRSGSALSTQITSTGPTANEGAPSDTPETAVERRRRLAALSGMKEDHEKETPAEQRRREAALGGGPVEYSDSDEDDSPRVPPARRGIRFADAPPRNKA